MLNFSTPQTPKSEECTALKHHHDGDEQKAKKHFESKLTQIFDAIETDVGIQGFRRNITIGSCKYLFV